MQQCKWVTALTHQDPPEPSAAVQQLPAPVPAVAAQHVQDAGLCFWTDPFLCDTGSPRLWSDAIPL